MICIYSIVSLNDGRRYIGSAKHFFRRKSVHLCMLRKGNHHSKFLQRAWNKYGEACFRFVILSVVDSLDQLIQSEQAWIDGYEPEYNINPIADSPLGRKVSDATREKLRISHLGKKHSEETRAKRSKALSIALKGHHVSAETRAKLSAIFKGFKHTEEAKRKISLAGKGKKKSPETIARMIAAQRKRRGYAH